MTTTAGAHAGPKAMQLAPYTFFYGRCEEALGFYKKALGGSYEVQRISEGPPMSDVSPNFQDKVMHATFTAPGMTFMASDGRETKAIDPEAGNISLSLGFTDGALADSTFKALSDGGKITMPLGEAFWGGRFGILNDRFGIEWMIVAP